MEKLISAVLIALASSSPGLAEEASNGPPPVPTENKSISAEPTRVLIGTFDSESSEKYLDSLSLEYVRTLAEKQARENVRRGCPPLVKSETEAEFEKRLVTEGRSAFEIDLAKRASKYRQAASRASFQAEIERMRTSFGKMVREHRRILNEGTKAAALKVAQERKLDYVVAKIGIFAVTGKNSPVFVDVTSEVMQALRGQENMSPN